MKKWRLFLLLVSLIALTGCSPSGSGQLSTIPVIQTSTLDRPTEIPSPMRVTDTLLSETQVLDTAEVPTYTEAPIDWKIMPIVPVVSARMVDIYRTGLKAGQRPDPFFKDRRLPEHYNIFSGLLRQSKTLSPG